MPLHVFNRAGEDEREYREYIGDYGFTTLTQNEPPSPDHFGETILNSIPRPELTLYNWMSDLNLFKFP